ncbi:MAG: F0F1 ATP synthase subunit B [Patescibacteria group bacterium]|nr:F0F1 ATP synthase subunit B [Patescibacteria group bacterium]
MDSLINTFHIDWKIIIAQAINFGVVFLVLYLFALKPLKKLMDKREDKITKGVEDAKHNAELVQKTKEEYDEVITKAKSEAHQLFQQGKKDAEIKKTEMMTQAKEEVSTLIANGKKTLDNEKVKMVEEAKKEVVDLVVKVTEKILEENDNKFLDKKTIEKI